MKKTLLLTTLLLLTGGVVGCAPSQHYVEYQGRQEAKVKNCALDVYTQGLELHKKTQVIGEMQIVDTGFSVNCDAETVMKQIKAKACEEGAEAIHLYDIRHPSLSGSTCFQANARFLIYQK